MAAVLVSNGYNETVFFRWSGDSVQISRDSGATWTNCFSAIETPLDIVEYFDNSLGAWIWCLLYQTNLGDLLMKKSSDHGVTWS